MPLDYAVDESFKRERDEPFDPWYFQWGEAVGEGAYRVEDEVYIERVLDEAEFDRVETIEFEWEGQAYRIPRPEELGDVSLRGREGNRAPHSGGLDPTGFLAPTPRRRIPAP